MGKQHDDDADDMGLMDDGDDYCGLCRGTGIGQHGDPDTSKCRLCGGTGMSSSHRQEQRDYEADVRRDMEIDRKLIEEG